MGVTERLLSADAMEGFAGIFLSPRYDNPVATPHFHIEGWDLYTSDYPQCVLIAPRDHAKSTAFTFDYILAECLFRRSSYVILIGSTEENAAEQLSNIIEEIRENDELIKEFGIAELERDSQTDLIVRMDDGHRFRVLARGAEQKIRGKMWNGKRPDLIVMDDAEDDEQVENKERRAKFRRWFFRAAKQALSRTGRIRVHGTILHEDSLLSRLIKCSRCKIMTSSNGTTPCVKCGEQKTWKHLFYKAHRSFSDFGGLLWPAAWTVERLRSRQREFIEDGDAGGYSQEFLNEPRDNAEAYLRRGDFLPMTQADHEIDKVICAAADFAVSKADLANRTSFTIGGKCTRGLLHFTDQRVDRWSSMEILPDGSKAGWIEEMFSIQTRWNPRFFFVEDGVIWKSVSAMVYNEMREREIYINIIEVPSIKDKATRGRTLQKRMKAGACRFDKSAEWYPGFEDELLKFTGGAQATLDDQFDSASLLAKGFEEHLPKVEDDDFVTDEEADFESESMSHFRKKDDSIPGWRTGYR